MNPTALLISSSLTSHLLPGPLPSPLPATRRALSLSLVSSLDPHPDPLSRPLRRQRRALAAEICRYEIHRSCPFRAAPKARAARKGAKKALKASRVKSTLRERKANGRALDRWRSRARSLRSTADGQRKRESEGTRLGITVCCTRLPSSRVSFPRWRLPLSASHANRRTGGAPREGAN